MCLYLGDDRALLCDSIWGMTRPWKVSWFWNVAKPWDVWYQVLTFSESCDKFWLLTRGSLQFCLRVTGHRMFWETRVLMFEVDPVCLRSVDRESRARTEGKVHRVC